MDCEADKEQSNHEKGSDVMQSTYIGADKVYLIIFILPIYNIALVCWKLILNLVMHQYIVS